MRRFDACALCLNSAREPLVCQEGHLFCKECVYTDLLTQKKDIKRQKDRLVSLKKEAEEERARARQAARERVLEEFERGQLGLSGGVSSIAAKAKAMAEADEPKTGSKRKFEFSADTVKTLAAEAEEAAMRQIEKEQAAALKAKLPDFWLPSLTPTYKANLSEPKTLDDLKIPSHTMCRGGVEAHPLALKGLIPIHFTMYTASSPPTGSANSTPSTSTSTTTKQAEGEPMCPSCKKRLSNNILLFCSKACGHVTCKTCTDTLVKPALQCIVCDKKLQKDDVIELKREGTGFAGGGLAETKKSGIAFQG
ncbi:hypothetical protein CVT24_012499 [Panaeolus cyanescens]|uniref:RING-type domain-containing protein n=1 Tax=Panaeolus cyanescens TaxID=181874 RepID=A0A409YLA5_9AGAR|nr:hypothetical protein CVT24_012499 [Panaeolus cyanescens]